MKKAVLALILTMAVASQAFADEIDEARELLSKERDGDILYLSRINLGISGGDNWIANWSDGWTRIFIINDNKDVKEAGGIGTVEISDIRYLISRNTYNDLEYDIMQGIPGTRLGSKAANFGDYDNDGIDEIFYINPYNESRCSIWKYDSDKEELVIYFSYRFDLISSGKPSPVTFANYQGKDGILVHNRNHLAEQYVWYFFVWSEENRKYEKLMEIDADDMDWSMFDVVKNENSQIDSEPAAVERDFFVAESKQPEDRKKFSFDDGKDSRLIFYIAIAVGVIALALAVVFVVRRKKG
jgi:hypothetical protein